MNSISCLVLVCLLALTAGCGRGSKEPPPPTGPSTAPASPRNPGRIAETPPPATVISNSGDANATLQQLTQTLRDYVVRTRSVPKNFEEFAAKSQAQFPPAPAGKKYVIQGQQIVLLDR